MTAAPDDAGPVTVAEILRELDLALTDHMVWLKAWHRSLLCGEGEGGGGGRGRSGPASDLGRFGAWFVRNQHTGLVNQPAFRDLAALYRDVHARADALIGATPPGGPVAAEAYDAVMDAAIAFVARARRLEKAFARASSDLDPLTGVHNRLVMARELDRERARALRAARPCCLALADLDRFKAINDTYGHAAGDRVLAAAAQCFLATLRPYDTIYRYGGEEFLFCLPDAPAPIAARVLDRVLGALRGKAIPIRDGCTVTVTCSFGVAQIDGEASVEETLKRADQALYRAKSEGRNRVCVWDQGAAAEPPPSPPA
ncbi:MAG: diguanylate cyclase [Rhodospirillales bacterium]